MLRFDTIYKVSYGHFDGLAVWTTPVRLAPPRTINLKLFEPVSEDKRSPFYKQEYPKLGIDTLMYEGISL